MSHIDDEIRELSLELYQTYTKLQELKKQKEPQPVKNYEFLTENHKPIHLLDMFKDQDYMIVIHNMGGKCSWCTAWADGFSGIYPLISKEAAFYVSSPDSPEQQAVIKSERGWQFPMVSITESRFAKDMGFQEGTSYFPGLSVFVKNADETISRINSAPIGPSDQFGVLWHLYDLLPNNPMS